MNAITKNSEHLARDPFETSEFSIAWAKDHIAELEREVNAFLNDNDACAYVVETSSNDDTWQMIKFKLCKPMPRPLRGHATDAAINIRNALDQAICSVTDLCRLPTHSTYFPIAISETKFIETFKGPCGKLPKDIRDVISGAMPYKGGNDLLWALNSLANTNKHGILRPVMLSNALIEMSGFELGTCIFDPPQWDSNKEELVLAKVPVGHKFQFNYETALFIAFNEIEFIDGQEVLAVLHHLCNMVEGIVMTIKAETKRIGLL